MNKLCIIFLRTILGIYFYRGAENEGKEILDKKRKLESLIYQSHIQNDKKRKRKKTLRKTHLLKKVLRK